MAVGAVVARILTQYSDKGSKAAQKDLYKLGKSFDAYAKKASRAVGLVAVAASAAAVKIGKDSVMAASDVSQQFGALDAVFGSNAKQLKDFSKEMVEYGLSAADSARFSALLGTQLTGLGLSQQDAIERTQKLQILAADLAATYGGTTADAVAALSSTFKGEYNPIERYGVAIRKSDITARVAAKGLKGLTGEALKAAEAQAAYELILNKTTAAQGQSGREFNTLAAQLQRLDAGYKNIQASLGLALLPVVQEFAEYLLTSVIPQIQNWVDINKDQLATSLKNAAGFAKDLLEVAGKLALWATNNIGFIKAMGVAIGAMFVVGKVTAFISAIQALIGVYRTLAATAGAAAVASAFATGGLSLAAGGAAIAGYAFLVQYLHDGNVEAKKAAELQANLGKGVYDVTKQVYGGAAAEKYKSEVAAAAAKQKAADDARAARAAKASETALKKDAALKAAIAKGQAALDKMGVKTKEDDPIQLEAARLNLIKQGNLAEAARLAVMTKNLELQLEANKALSRYNDLLAALADKEITSDEVFLLAKKWGMTIEAAQSYIQTLLAVSDQAISDDEVTNLAKAWGVSKDQASRYLDFFNALNDGKLSDAEIAKLQTKWGLTSKEVQVYADLITKASDYVLSDAEITALGTNWGLTTKEVVEYIKKLGQPVTFSGTLIDPATQAELGWKNALAALLAYQAALAGKGYSAGPTGGPAYDPNASADANKEAADAAAAAANAAAEAAKANSDATAAALKAAEKVISMAVAIESATIKSSTGQKFLTDAQMDSALTSAGSVYGTGRSDSAVFADEQSKFRAMNNISPTLTNSSSIGSTSSGGGTTVNLVVNGSVSTEQDLVSAVRQGLLATQTNGNTLTLQAI